MKAFDSPWKEALDLFLAYFLMLCLPDIYAQIDWSRGVTALDGELRKILRSAKTGSRSVDRLYRVYLKTGKVRLLHIHIEVQCQRDPNLPERVFVYHHRIWELKAGMPMTLVVFGDDSPKWRPSKFRQECFGCVSTLKYNTVKLLDFRNRIEELAESDNPMAPFIVAHLQTLATTEDDPLRKAWKFRLIRSLYEKGLDRDEILRRFRLIDWIMNLKDDLEEEFERELTEYERSSDVPYITAIERNGIKKGRVEGRVEGQIRGKLYGRIQTYQEQLGLPVESDEDLDQLSVEALRQKEEALNRQVQAILLPRSTKAKPARKNS